MKIVSYYKDIITNPKTFFKNIEEYKATNIIYSLFILSVSLTIFKSFFEEPGLVNFNFFRDESLNRLFEIYSTPYVQWILVYLFYYIFILISVKSCKYLNPQCNTSNIVASLISINSLGLLLSIIAYILETLLLFAIPSAIYFIIYFWLFSLNMIVLDIYSKVNLLRFTLFLALPCIFVQIIGTTTPSLMWINPPEETTIEDYEAYYEESFKGSVFEDATE